MVSNAFILFLVAVVMTAKEGSAEPKCYREVTCPNDATQGRKGKHDLETVVNKMVNVAIEKTNDCPGQSATTTCKKGMTKPDKEPRISVRVFSREALCDTVTDGGGWIVIQRRTKGDVNFHRDWEYYKRGFGTITTDYWLGLENIHRLTSSDPYELRVDLTYKGVSYYAQYSTFAVGDHSSDYRLTVDGYTGNAGDSLGYHRNSPFSTFDHGGNICASKWQSGWWYANCFNAHLNGVWASKGFSGLGWDGVVFPGSVTSSEMKIRRV